jgi:hypothetical protein
MTNEELDRELERMAGSPTMAKAIKGALERLSGGSAGSDLAEMARDVLAGRTDLRTVGQSSGYSTQLTEAIGAYQQWEAELSPEEREELQAETRRGLESPPHDEL